MINRDYVEYSWEKAKEALAIDSPTGFTAKAAQWGMEAFQELGYDARIDNKGGVIVDLGGPDNGDGLLITVHLDTLGAMVATIKSNGRLQLSGLGGMRPENGETENLRIYTRSGRVYEGTLQMCNASVHVNGDYKDIRPTFLSTEVVIDEDTRCARDTRELGIEVGDIVCMDTRTIRTSSDYLKSRFLDDKLSVGITLGFAKYLKDHSISLNRKVYVHLTVYEEVGHGACGFIPAGITEILSVDMGCVGEHIQCTERQVSICAKDSGGPYSYEMVGKLIDAAKATGADYAVDVYPFYGSDANAALRAGADTRHGLIGPGVYASHGYERGHMDGVYNTLLVLCGYLGV